MCVCQSCLPLYCRERKKKAFPPSFTLQPHTRPLVFHLVERLDSVAAMSNATQETEKGPTHGIRQGPADMIMTDYANRSRTDSATTEQVFSNLVFVGDVSPSPLL